MFPRVWKPVCGDSTVWTVMKGERVLVTSASQDDLQALGNQKVRDKESLNCLSFEGML
jgi:uncharacterized protein YajQ (UPF0234 family)